DRGDGPGGAGRVVVRRTGAGAVGPACGGQGEPGRPGRGRPGPQRRGARSPVRCRAVRRGTPAHPGDSPQRGGDGPAHLAGPGRGPDDLGGCRRLRCGAVLRKPRGRRRRAPPARPV
ncbi:MAG: FIG00820565: hypothetical protein, partial [uncultured Pseudonocardia sp.]